MEFRNLTPFAAQCYDALDVDDREYRVVVIKVGYDLQVDPQTGDARLSVKDSDPVGLCYVDEYYGAPGQSSVRRESDLAPFKPRCDVILQGHTHAPFGRPSRSWIARLALRRAGNPNAPLLLDKALRISAPRIFYKDYLGWGLYDPQTTSKVPLDWEHAFGGSSRVPNPKHAEDPAQPEWLLNEVCYSNPLGTGWMDKLHRKMARQAGHVPPDNLPVPQITYPDDNFKPPLLVRHPEGSLDAPAMARVVESYGQRPAGFGIVGRAWTPRLQKAGTFDQQWLDERWPGLPGDFDFAYWNGAPQDQQIAYPPPDAVIELSNLLPPACSPHGTVLASLPGHRAFVLAWFEGGGLLPLNAVIDTLAIDTDALLVEVAWRCLVPTEFPLEALEARFETDPDAPLIKTREV
ncbi:DUF2169 family type VI secretion system accessory protein [Pseudomonas schmalbachii]|uniref:DUF2169 domain-containing protein n=1 Tax=Pseudomonas schmalbachii TaxID=2816993 RepID=A0ABS3TT69_9PSED|nr:DUF2169 domain-containing protein [Pseudomonas schmalbachii]MBO3275759.1 DUF2169 domain-containing protein [Pseudomonas schmalbachii]